MKPRCNSTFQFNFTQPPEMLGLEGGSRTNLSEFEMRFRLALKRVTDSSDRADLAAAMTQKLGREVTKVQIDGWIALSTPERRIHADALKALCECVGNYEPLRVLAEACGFKLMTPQEASAAEYGATMLLKEMIEGDLKSIKGRINKNKLREDLQKRLGE